MNTFKILQDGSVVLHEKHQGNQPNSGAYFHYAFARYALEKELKSRGNAVSEIYYLNGRQKWTLEQLNLVANYMGIDKFFWSLRNNTGGATFKYDQSVLRAIDFWDGDNDLGAYPPTESLEYLQSIGYRNENLFSIPAFQTAGEEEYRKISISDDGVFEEYEGY